MILVTGATGTVGREVVAQLVAKGERVRAMTRNPEKTQPDSRVELVRGDFDAPDTLVAAVRGADRVFSLTGGPQTPGHDKNLAEAAKKAGVKRVVKLSAMGGDETTRNDIRKWHDAGAQAFRDAGLPLTVLLPTGFMSNALHWRGMIKAQGKVFSNYGEGKLPYVHPRDIAAVAAVALTADGHEGKAYPLTGPEALSVGEQVRILSEATGREIAFVAISDEEARAGMQKSGMPGFVIDALIPFASFIRSGKAARVENTVEKVTGRKALTFVDWARENAGAFA